MNNSDLIDSYYSAATKGIKEEWFSGKYNDKWYNYIVNLPEKEKIVYLIAILDEEIANGGISQYFVNRYGQFALETIEALKLIGAEKASSIVKRAYLKVNNENIPYSLFRKKIFLNKIDSLFEDDDLDNYLEKLDNEYCEYEDNIGMLLVNYLQKR
jgi:hypothetical protein